MARHEGKFDAAGEAQIDFKELFGAMEQPLASGARRRREAIARFLSAGEGWRDAAIRLNGAFASLGGRAGLTDAKE